MYMFKYTSFLYSKIIIIFFYICNILDCLTETSKTITMILPLTTEKIVNELIMHCVIYLKQVSDIPRLYRRTNREVPIKPCAYVKNALSFLTSFRTNYNDFVPMNVTIWLQLALSLLTEQ